MHVRGHLARSRARFHTPPASASFPLCFFLPASATRAVTLLASATGGAGADAGAGAGAGDGAAGAGAGDGAAGAGAATSRGAAAGGSCAPRPAPAAPSLHWCFQRHHAHAASTAAAPAATATRASRIMGLPRTSVFCFRHKKVFFNLPARASTETLWHHVGDQDDVEEA